MSPQAVAPVESAAAAAEETPVESAKAAFEAALEEADEDQDKVVPGELRWRGVHL